MGNSIKSRFTSGNTIFLTILVCILSFQISNAQWVQVSNGMGNLNVNAFTYSGNNLFAGTGVYTGGQGVYLTTNNGENWTQTSLINRTVSSLAVNGNYIFAATDNAVPNNDVFLSTNNGANWTPATLTTLPIKSLIVNGSYIFAGLYNFGGVYKSTNNGTNWTQTFSNRSMLSFAANGNNIFAGCAGATGVILSTNNGANWTQTSLNNQYVSSLAIIGNNIFAGTGLNILSPNGVFLSTDNGTSWNQTSLNNKTVPSLTVSGNYIFAGTNQYGVYVSNDNGANWTQMNEGLGNLNVNAFCILNNYIFAGTGAGVYRRPLGELTGMQPISNEIPNQFSLLQNYPNPFNPNTNIQFAIPKSLFVKLVVYDMLGRGIETLVNENLNAGSYKVDWPAFKNASKYSSGVYFYRLVVRQAGSSTVDYVDTKKMILIK